MKTATEYGGAGNTFVAKQVEEVILPHFFLDEKRDLDVRSFLSCYRTSRWF
jgi:hypothetical protein